MRIEISADHLSFDGSAVFQADFNQFISDADNMIASFAAVKQSAYELPGGADNLTDAIDQLDQRIQREEERKQQASKIQSMSDQLWTTARTTDQQVAALVDKNKEDLYRIAPYLRPDPPPEEETLLEQAWNWLCGVGEAIVEGVTSVFDMVGDCLKKIKDSIVEFYLDHKKIIDTLLVVVGAIGAIAAVAGTGGIALVPLLTALGASGTVASTISGAVAITAVVTTVGFNALNIKEIWYGLSETEKKWQTRFGIVSAVSNITYNVGTIYNSIKKYDYNDIRNYVKQSKDKNDIIRGGGYDTVRQNSIKGKYEAHECPPISATRPAGDTATTTERAKLNLPSVRLEKADHMLTASYGHRASATQYVAKQRELINSGKIAEAFKMDIKDLEQFGFKYAKGIQEMKKYAKIYMKGWK